jgi:alkanesulfonate monooxygenase SsuD/methylene tetrahydromethanopterin reductase-like flavin-dependent oxidoreductase (luciferase family)
MWSTPVGDTFSYEGKQHSVKNSPGLPKPIQHESHSFGPPIVMGGWGAKRTPRLAAKHAAEYNLPFSPVANVASQFDRVRSACDEVGRDPSTLTMSVAVVACCGEDEAAFARRAAAIGQEPEGLRANQLGGTADEVADRAAAYRDAGAQRLYLQVLDLHDLEHLHLLAETLRGV